MVLLELKAQKMQKPNLIPVNQNVLYTKGTQKIY